MYCNCIDEVSSRDESVVAGLYHDFALQCKNCGLRFADREKMDKHLDWHFLQNRKEKEKTKKAMARNWYLPKEEWISQSDISQKAGKYVLLLLVI
jgi:pre-mRNA cleavage complex 2 protein Pcf11